MLKVLILALMIAPPVWTQPLTQMEELQGVLMLLIEAQEDYQKGLIKISNGQTELIEGLTKSRAEVAKLRMGQRTLKEETINLQQQLIDSERGLTEYKAGIQVAAEEQKAAIRGLKTSRTISFIAAGAAVVGLILVVIFK